MVAESRPLFAAYQLTPLHQAGVPIWQRNYYERIIRDERELNNVRQYIENSPRGLASDKENT